MTCEGGCLLCFNLRSISRLRTQSKMLMLVYGKSGFLPRQINVHLINNRFLLVFKERKDHEQNSLSISLMEQISDSMKNQIAALLRAIGVAQTLRDDNKACKIEEGLFVGSIGAANNRDALRSLNIRHILTVASSLRPVHRCGFVYKVIPVLDKEDTNIAQYFGECFDFIDEARRQGSSVLVHCFAGRSRSVTIVVAYLMKKNGMSLSEAMDHVRSKRPQAAPNSGFIIQLQEFERSLQVNQDVNK